MDSIIYTPTLQLAVAAKKQRLLEGERMRKKDNGDNDGIVKEAQDEDKGDGQEATETDKKEMLGFIGKSLKY